MPTRVWIHFMGCISVVRYTVSVESVQSRGSMSGRFYHWRGSSSMRGIKATATDALLVDVAPNVFRHVKSSVIPSLHIMSE